MRNIYVLFILFALILGLRQSAVAQCSEMTFAFVQYEPCKFRLSVDNANDVCYTEIRLTLEQGTFASWNVNTAAGFEAQVISPSEIWITHTSGMMPFGSFVPILFDLPPGIVSPIYVGYINACPPGTGCELFPAPVLESCPDPQDASISGVKYVECGGLPYLNQPTVAGWPIQLLDANGILIAETVTDNTGTYGFYDLPAGTYEIREADSSSTGWTANVPPTGMYAITLGASEQAVRNFGNCPTCSCDSVTLSVLSEPYGSLDTNCYKLVVDNNSADCFEYVNIEVDTHKTITGWNVLLAGWTVSQISPHLLRVFPPAGSLPIGVPMPISFCVTGGNDHVMHLSTSFGDGSPSNQCETTTQATKLTIVVAIGCAYSISFPDHIYMVWRTRIGIFVRANQHAQGTTTPYHLETAVLKPVSFPAPKLLFTNIDGSMATTTDGQAITMEFDSSTTAKIQDLKPAPAGFEWYGLKSNPLTTSNLTEADSSIYDARFIWQDLPAGSQDSTGAMWFSDNSDDLYGELITDGYTDFGAAVKVPNTEYGVSVGTCSFSLGFPQLVNYSWELDWFCRDAGTRVAANPSKYHLQTAVLMPDYFPAPKVKLTDPFGNPVVTPFGETISLVASGSVSDKLESVSPAPVGFVWYGLQSNDLTPSESGNPDSADFKIRFYFENLPEGSQQTAVGKFWVSDDKDDLDCELVSDASYELGIAAPGPNTEYGCTIGTCTFSVGFPQLVNYSWEIDWFCRDAGTRVAANPSKYHLQTAVLMPDYFPAPKVKLTDPSGNPVVTAFGEVISLMASNAVTDKIQTSSPAPQGFVWYGLQSNDLTPSESGSPDSADFKIRFYFENLPEGSQQTAVGKFWVSDDKGDLDCELVSDGSYELGIAVPGSNTNYGCTDATCTFGIGFPELINVSWSINFYCDDYGDRVAANPSKFRIQSAVLVPFDFPAPIATLTDPDGNPVTTPFGEQIDIMGSSAVSDKIEALSPAPAGFVWYGMQSNAITPSDDGIQQTTDFEIKLCWNNLPDSSQNATGKFWVSDDKGDLDCELISDGSIDLSASIPANPGTEYEIDHAECFIENDILIWLLKEIICRDYGTSWSNRTYQLQTAVQMPEGFENPGVELVDAQGNQVVIGGTTVVLSESQEVSDHIQALSPAEPGKKWFGLISNTLEANSSGALDSALFDIRFSWPGPPAGSQTATGSFWIGDNKDDLHCMHVREGIISLSAPLAAEEVEVYPLKIHPNPTTNNFTVELPQPAIPGMQLRIAGIAGNTLLTLNLPPGTTTEIVPSEEFPGGIYLLQILSDERVLGVQKLVKL